jgi:hypothetical protein
MKPPFPWFGGKSRAAPLIWERFGPVPNFVEPFFGSGAVLFGRPHEPGVETVNDKGAHLANFWRAVQRDPECVAHWVDWPINEADLHARHLWLVTTGAERVERLKTDPDYYDAKIAGWWVWGVCQWIGSGWCSAATAPGGRGYGRPPEATETFEDEDADADLLGSAGMGVHRKRPHLGNAGRGVHRQLPHLGNAGRGQSVEWTAHLVEMMGALSDRLRRVRVCCGDWSRVCGPTPTVKQGLTGVLLDPPYSHAEREPGLYAVEEDISADVRRWALEWGDDPRMRIAYCDYGEADHDFPPSWERVPWKAHGGYGSQGNGRGRDNSDREMLYFSPHCLKPCRPRQWSLFEGTLVG